MKKENERERAKGPVVQPLNIHAYVGIFNFFELHAIFISTSGMLHSIYVCIYMDIIYCTFVNTFFIYKIIIVFSI